MAFKERSEKSNQRNNDKPHDSLRYGFFAIDEVLRNQIDENGSHHGEGVGYEFKNEPDNKLFCIRGHLLMKVILRDYLRGATAPSLCFSEFQTDAQFS